VLNVGYVIAVGLLLCFMLFLLFCAVLCKICSSFCSGKLEMLFISAKVIVVKISEIGHSVHCSVVPFVYMMAHNSNRSLHQQRKQQCRRLLFFLSGAKRLFLLPPLSLS